MPQFFVLALGMLAALTFTGGCSRQDNVTVASQINQIPAEPFDQVLPTYPSRYWQEELKNEMAALQPDERSLLEKFLLRHIKTSPTSEQVPVPDGTTIEKAIFAQRIIDTITARQDAETTALTELIQMQEDELLALRETALRCEEVFKNSITAKRSQNFDVPAEDVTAYTKAREEILISYGVPELEAQLRIAMQKDRSDPDWQKFQTDSPVTAGIRIRLLAAKRAADQTLPPYKSGR